MRLTITCCGAEPKQRGYRRSASFLLLISTSEIRPIEQNRMVHHERSRMVELRGVEPLTSCLQSRRSDQLSYSPIGELQTNKEQCDAVSRKILCHAVASSEQTRTGEGGLSYEEKKERTQRIMNVSLRIQYLTVPTFARFGEAMVDNLLRRLEVPAGIAPANGGFADPCLTTWLRHQWIQSELRMTDVNYLPAHRSPSGGHRWGYGTNVSFKRSTGKYLRQNRGESILKSCAAQKAYTLLPHITLSPPHLTQEPG